MGTDMTGTPTKYATGGIVTNNQYLRVLHPPFYFLPKKEQPMEKTIQDVYERANYDPIIHQCMATHMRNPSEISEQDAVIAAVLVLSETLEAVRKDMIKLIEIYSPNPVFYKNTQKEP